jgi:integrase
MARYGEGSIYRKTDGTWAGQINMAPEGAKRQRRTVYGKTKAEVQRKLGEAREAKKRGDHSTSSMTFGQWLDRWLERTDLKPTTRKGYRSTINTHLKPLLGNVRLDRLNTGHVDALHDAMRARPGVGSTTIRNAHRCASSALSAAVAQGRVHDNVFRKVPAPAKTGRKPEALVLDAAQKVEAIASRSDAELTSIYAALYCGLRPGERLGLRWSHVDFDRKRIDLEWQMQKIDWTHGCGDKPCGRKRGGNCPQRWLGDLSETLRHEIVEDNYVLHSPKTVGSQRIVPIPNFMVGPLRRHYVAYLEAQLRADFIDHGLVWHDGNGRPVDPRKDREAWHALLTEAKVSQTTLYAARHTAATLLLEKGVDAKVIQPILGHSDVLTTRGYQQVRVELARSALDREDEPAAIEG